jgi:hypothetical protein
VNITLTGSDTKQMSLGSFINILERDIDKSKEARQNLLIGLCALSMDLVKGDIATEENQTLFSIASSIYSVLQLDEVEYPLLDDSDENISYSKVLARKVAKVADGIVPDNYRHSDGSLNREALELDWIATLTNNTLFQGNSPQQIASIMVIVGLKGYGELEPNTEKINKIFKRSVDYSAEDYFKILFSFWCMSLENIFLDTRKLYQNSTIPHELKAIGDAVLKDLSLGVKREKHRIDFANAYSGMSKPMSVFCRYPLIKASPNHYLFTSKAFLKLQVTSKFLNKSLKFARDYEGQASTEFSSYLGKDRFERFFYELVKKWVSKNTFLKEYKYTSVNDNSSPDLVCIEPHGHSTVTHLFQLKLKMPTESMLYGESFDKIENDLEVFSELIYRSIKYLYNLHIAEIKGNLDRLTKEFSKKVLAARHCCLFGVIPTSSRIFSNLIIRRRLLKHVYSKLSQDEKDWFLSKYRNGKNFHWYIFTLPEIQTFLGLPDENLFLYKEFSRYHRISLVDQILIKKGYAPPDFGSFLLSLYQANKQVSISQDEVLLEIFDSYFDEIIQFLRLH